MFYRPPSALALLLLPSFALLFANAKAALLSFFFLKKERKGKVKRGGGIIRIKKGTALRRKEDAELVWLECPTFNGKVFGSSPDVSMEDLKLTLVYPPKKRIFIACLSPPPPH